MTKSHFVFMALIVVSTMAASAPPDNLGKRTATPAQTLSGLSQADPEAEQQRLVAAAAAFPLGTVDNPVRVGGPEGERAYLARLRCADGSIPRIGAARPGGNGAFGNVVDLFPLDCGNAAPGRSVLLLDIYHEEHIENQAPPGFSIVGH
jgi:hypothetical protein